jgi:hypothetical protein
MKSCWNDRKRRKGGRDGLLLRESVTKGKIDGEVVFNQFFILKIGLYVILPHVWEVMWITSLIFMMSFMLLYWYCVGAIVWWLKKNEGGWQVWPNFGLFLNYIWSHFSLLVMKFFSRILLHVHTQVTLPLTNEKGKN